MKNTFYHTIEGTGEGLYKEKGSKFIGVVLPVQSEDHVKERLEELRKTYYDARHHCYAYILGADRSLYRANDDGEPNHSAGDPILGQINSKNLTDVLVVVVRYFGGTKLGVSGLINAYKTAAEDALANVKVVKVEITERIIIQYDYDATNEVMRLVDDLQLRIVDQQFVENCTMIADVKIGFLEEVHERVQLLSDTGNSVKIVDD